MSSLDEESIEDRSDAASEAASEAGVVDGGVASQDKDDDDDDTAQADIESMAPDDEDDATTIKSEADETSIASKRKRATPKGKKGRSPAVKGLTIPFRNVKRTMKLDPDIATVQQEAAILTTLASELFLKSLAKESYQNAQSRGRTTIRYEDIAEARTKDPSLAFLDTLLP
jgi:histone H3/H4